MKLDLRNPSAIFQYGCQLNNLLRKPLRIKVILDLTQDYDTFLLVEMFISSRLGDVCIQSTRKFPFKTHLIAHLMRFTALIELL